MKWLLMILVEVARDTVRSSCCIFAEKSNIQKPQPGLGAVVKRESLCAL